MLLAVLLAGCAGFSPDGGMSGVQDIAGAELDNGSNWKNFHTATPQEGARDQRRCDT
jgi:hypothetical protein